MTDTDSSTRLTDPFEVGWMPTDTAPTRFVDERGDLTEAGHEHGVDIELAKVLHRDMARARRLDQEALALQRQGELGLWLQSWGQEAAQVGSMRALRDSDHVFPSYREHAAAMVRGISPRELLSQWRGATHGGWDPETYNFHLNSLVLGTQTLHATGYAMGYRLSNSDAVAAVYFGDGAASQGDVNEAFNWAAARSLPVLFVCQNNQWAISTPTSHQYAAPVHQRAAGFGLRSYFVDGNDALAVHSVTRAAVAHIRLGHGPALIEAVTFRMAGHSTSDDPKKYRPTADFDAWHARDPLRRSKVLLSNSGVPAAFFDTLDVELDELAIETRAACHAITAPDLDDLFATAYSEPHPALAAERADRANYLQRMTAGA
ncbi:thiamine pyrophosphate-dependent enzyme [Rhodococcoides fascians]|jgi:2-oxoisovalerate dehydrogenase E1 component alpha subunit|uniref:thiamine pyrophosphate-dependent enzyme n=1 Tax=Rhodococcoides fascians TaxID=1828 RepID=UPI001D6323F3|nr:thiamine pyrophosphate-dependent enzyme [Rhodococcus fascians]CAH0236199.1 3-methyl-2-oxobutanoate dehydrogenase subunit alpha [Rhodococcus fascians]